MIIFLHFLLNLNNLLSPSWFVASYSFIILKSLNNDFGVDYIFFCIERKHSSIPMVWDPWSKLGVSKKIKKSRKSKKNNRKNRTVKKNLLKFWKNQLIRFNFGFRSLKPKKPNRTKPNPNRSSQTGKKPSQTGLNRFLS